MEPFKNIKHTTLNLWRALRGQMVNKLVVKVEDSEETNNGG